MLSETPRGFECHKPYYSYLYNLSHLSPTFNIDISLYIFLTDLHHHSKVHIISGMEPTKGMFIILTEQETWTETQINSMKKRISYLCHL